MFRGSFTTPPSTFYQSNIKKQKTSKGGRAEQGGIKNKKQLEIG